VIIILLKIMNINKLLLLTKLTRPPVLRPLCRLRPLSAFSFAGLNQPNIYDQYLHRSQEEKQALAK